MADERPLEAFSRLCLGLPAQQFGGLTMFDATCFALAKDTYKGHVNEALEKYRLTGHETAAQLNENPLFAAIGTAMQQKVEMNRRMFAEVEAAGPNNNDPRLLDIAQRLRAQPLLLQAITVNEEVNASVTYQTDQQMHGKSDVWQTPMQTLKSLQGDCEDYALLKISLLEQAGLPAKNMWLAVGIMTNAPLTNGAPEWHATLVIEVDKQKYVLDNAAVPRHVAPVGLVPFDTYLKESSFTPTVLLNRDEVLRRDTPSLETDLKGLTEQAKKLQKDAAVVAQPLAPQIEDGPKPDVPANRPVSGPVVQQVLR